MFLLPAHGVILRAHDEVSGINRPVGQQRLVPATIDKPPTAPACPVDAAHEFHVTTVWMYPVCLHVAACRKRWFSSIVDWRLQRIFPFVQRIIPATSNGYILI
jgi:hypothetical protein